jgi:iron complex outermembrane receptor protein
MKKMLNRFFLQKKGRVCSFHIKLWIAPSLLLLVTTVPLFGQVKESPLQIRDAVTQEPIIGVGYDYNGKRGSTDSEGRLFLTYNEGAILFLSHVSYGIREVGSDEVKTALESGVLVWQPRTESLQPITVVTLREKQSGRSTVHVHQEEKMAHDSGVLLQAATGVSGIRKSGSYGFDPVIRGMKNDQINVIMDGGHSATAACPNRMDTPTSQFAANMVERVEIIKGPYALRFGNSFGGLVHFHSEEPSFSDQMEIFGRLTGGYESNGEAYRSEAMAGFRGEHIQASLFGSWADGSSYKSGDGTLIRSAYLRNSVGGRASLHTGNHMFTVSATHNFADGIEFASLGMDLISDKTTMVNAEHTLSFNEGFLQQIETSAWGTYVDHLMTNELRPMPKMMDMATSAETWTYGGRTEFQFQEAGRLFYTGADVLYQKADGERTRKPLMGPMAGKTMVDSPWQESEKLAFGVFAELQQRHEGNIKSVVSGRLSVEKAEALDPSQRFLNLEEASPEAQLLPSLSAGISKQWSSRFETLLSAGYATRGAGLTERFMNSFPVGVDPYELIGNPNLDPEQNFQVDLSANWTSNQIQFTVSGYVSMIQNYISSVIDPTVTPVTPSSPGVRRFVNLDQARISGFELEYSQLFGRAASHHLSMSYTTGQDLDREEPLPEIAPFELRYRWALSLMGGALRPEATFRYVAKQDRVSSAFGELTTPSFTTVDLSAAQDLFGWITVTAGVQNLFDENYAEHLSRRIAGTQTRLYAPGRNVYAKVALSF